MALAASSSSVSSVSCAVVSVEGKGKSGSDALVVLSLSNLARRSGVMSSVFTLVTALSLALSATAADGFVSARCLRPCG